MKRKKRVDIVIPVYNNYEDLPSSIETQTKYYAQVLAKYDWRIIIAHNGVLNSTLELAKKLARKHDRVAWSHIDEQGRGAALRHAWMSSTADIVSYMDVDLATDLEAFPRLLQLLEESYDVAVGSKYIRGAHHQRRLRRYVASRFYNLLTRIILGAHFTDGQLGFKAAKLEAAQRIVPLIKDNFWFFDTEFLYYAEKLGLQIAEVPVTWKEGKRSGVKLIRTMVLFLGKMVQLRRGGL